MNRLWSPIALCLLAIGTIARAEDWRDHVPEGWLSVVEIRDVKALDIIEERLREVRPKRPWSVSLSRLTEALGWPIADRPWAFAVYEPMQPGGFDRFVLLVPIDDFAAFCEAVDADRAEDLAVFSFLLELAARPAGDGWVAITLLESANLFSMPKEPPPRLIQDSNTTAVVSPRGLRWLADKYGQEAQSRRISRREQRFPTTLAGVYAQLAKHGPVLGVLAAQQRPMAFGLSSANPKRLRLTIAWDLPLESAGSPASPSGVGDGIATLALAGSIPSPIIDLLLATIESAPDSLIEASEFPAELWRAFAGATRSLLDRVESPTLLLTSPGEGEPIAANQSATFAWKGEASELGEALLAAVTRWNQMTQATKARSPINAVLTPMPEAGGWRIRLNLLNPGDRDPIPEVQAVFKRYYGLEHGAQIDLVPTEGGRWLATFAAPDNHPELSPIAVQPGALATGSLRVDRWIAWERLLRLAAQGREETDTKPVPPAPPAELRLFSREGRTVLEAQLPWEALRLAYPQAK